MKALYLLGTAYLKFNLRREITVMTASPETTPKT